MNLQDAYDRITFKVGTPDDTSARATNPQVNNIVLLNELYDQLKSYANITKGIQDVYSCQLAPQISFIAAPPLALRSQGYRFAYIIINGTIYPMDFRGERDVFPNFRVNPVNGITNWVMPWNAGHSTYLSGFPNNATSILSTTMTSGIGATDTVIPVGSIAGQIHNFGRLTLGTGVSAEKVVYEYIDTTTASGSTPPYFAGVTRGMEGTTAAAWTTSTPVTQNNLYLFYNRLPVKVAAESDGTISAGTLAQVLEPCEEHMEGIIKATVYNLLLKIDIDRADRMKVDAEQLYGIYSKDISKGYAKNRMNINIRDPHFGNERGIPYGSGLY